MLEENLELVMDVDKEGDDHSGDKESSGPQNQDATKAAAEEQAATEDEEDSAASSDDEVIEDDEVFPATHGKKRTEKALQKMKNQLASAVSTVRVTYAY